MLPSNAPSALSCYILEKHVIPRPTLKRLSCHHILDESRRAFDLNDKELDIRLVYSVYQDYNITM